MRNDKALNRCEVIRSMILNRVENKIEPTAALLAGIPGAKKWKVVSVQIWVQNYMEAKDD